MLTWEDKAEIKELPARYNHAVDKREAREWADLFTEDGSVEIGGRILVTGRADLLAYIERNKALPAKRLHWISNVIVDAIGHDPDAARLRLYIGAYDTTEGRAGAPYSLGEYDDLVVREGGRWLFKRRRLSLLVGASGVDDQTRPSRTG